LKIAPAAFWTSLRVGQWRAQTLADDSRGNNMLEEIPVRKLMQMFGGKPAVVVQIGANDGAHGDLITALIRRNTDWRVVFIEPLPHIFRRLTANYPPSSNYTFENIAISQERGVRTMFYVSDNIKNAQPDVPWWYDQCGSFDRNHMLKHGFDEAFIASEDVRCEPLADVLARNGIDRIDLLYIDVEGYDFEVIKQLDVRRPQDAPKAILYEHKHLSESDKTAAEKLLSDAGYRIQRFSADTLATLSD
jgi:FkbM family methyltransferase